MYYVARWLSGKLWYLQHNCVGDTIVYHKASNVCLVKMDHIIRMFDLLMGVDCKKEHEIQIIPYSFHNISISKEKSFVKWKYVTGHRDGTAGDACVLLWLWLNPIMISKVWIWFVTSQCMSEWLNVTAFLGTADSEVHIVHIIVASLDFSLLCCIIEFIFIVYVFSFLIVL